LSRENNPQNPINRFTNFTGTITHALIYKDWGVSFLLFSTGKVILTGPKSLKQAEAGIENFRRLLNEFS